MHTPKNYDTKGIVGENSAGPITTDTKANYDFSPNLFNSNTISGQNGGSNKKITSYYKMNGGSNSFESALHEAHKTPHLAPNGGVALSYNTHSSNVAPSARPNHKHTGGSKRRTLKKKRKARKHKSRRHKKKSRHHKKKHKSRRHKTRHHKKKHKSRHHKKKSRKLKRRKSKSRRYSMRGGSGDLSKLSELPIMGVDLSPKPLSPSESALAPGNFRGYPVS